MGHIELSRDADLLVVAPATADLLAKMAHGLANDLASTVLLATDKPVLARPGHERHACGSTRRRSAISRSCAATASRSSAPNDGEMAEAASSGPAAWPSRWRSSRRRRALGCSAASRRDPLAGAAMLVTSGPTHEPIDPVRYIANRSSGKQGHAIAAALARPGAEVTLVSGPVGICPIRRACRTVHVETAREMLAAVEAALPADTAMFAAAVADWRVGARPRARRSRRTSGGPPALALVENPDILATVAHRTEGRPDARRRLCRRDARTSSSTRKAKLASKGCDWIVANDVSPQTGIMGGDRNTVHLVIGRRASRPGRPWTRTGRARAWRSGSPSSLKDGEAGRVTPARRGRAAAARRGPPPARYETRARPGLDLFAALARK